MKLNGVFGKGSGKVGNSVWAVSGGVQIVRPYNPNVSNPKTDAQVAQRAKFKLMSQIAADLASVIAIPKQGLVSSRNLFVSKNIGLVTFANEQASVQYPKLQLTAGTSSFPYLECEKNGGNLNAALEFEPTADVTAVVYIVCKVDENQQLSVVASKVVTEPGNGKTFDTTFANVSGQIVVYAYGVKNNSDEIFAGYGDYTIASASDVADLVLRNRLANGSGDLTHTSGLHLD